MPAITVREGVNPNQLMVKPYRLLIRTKCLVVYFVDGVVQQVSQPHCNLMRVNTDIFIA